jgi:hypothetical protein
MLRSLLLLAALAEDAGLFGRKQGALTTMEKEEKLRKGLLHVPSQNSPGTGAVVYDVQKRAWLKGSESYQWQRALETAAITATKRSGLIAGRSGFPEDNKCGIKGDPDNNGDILDYTGSPLFDPYEREEPGMPDCKAKMCDDLQMCCRFKAERQVWKIKGQVFNCPFCVRPFSNTGERQVCLAAVAMDSVYVTQHGVRDQLWCEPPCKYKVVELEATKRSRNSLSYAVHASWPTSSLGVFFHSINEGLGRFCRLLEIARRMQADLHAQAVKAAGKADAGADVDTTAQRGACKAVVTVLLPPRGDNGAIVEAAKMLGIKSATPSADAITLDRDVEPNDGKSAYSCIRLRYFGGLEQIHVHRLVVVPIDESSDATTGVVGSIRRMFAPPRYTAAAAARTAVAGGVLATTAANAANAAASAASVVILLRRHGTRSLNNHEAVLQIVTDYFSAGTREQTAGVAAGAGTVTHIVDFHRLPFASGLALFRHARLIVGPHGSGFVNMMWATADRGAGEQLANRVALLEIANCKERAGKWECSDGMAGRLFERMAKLLGHEHCLLKAEGSHQKDDPMDVGLAGLKEALGKCMQASMQLLGGEQKAAGAWPSQQLRRI